MHMQENDTEKTQVCQMEISPVTQSYQSCMMINRYVTGIKRRNPLTKNSKHALLYEIVDSGLSWLGQLLTQWKVAAGVFGVLT